MSFNPGFSLGRSSSVGDVHADNKIFCRCCGEQRDNEHCALLADFFRPPSKGSNSLVHCMHICDQCQDFVGNLLEKILTKPTQDRVLKYFLGNKRISLPSHHVFVNNRMEQLLESTSGGDYSKCKTCMPYVPGLVAEYLVERWVKRQQGAQGPEQTPGKELSLGAISDTATDCVIMMADVTGYTALAELMCVEKGVNLGVETLVTECLNSYFTKLIDTIYEYGGDVVKFAGDALICVWKPQAAPPQNGGSSSTNSDNDSSSSSSNNNNNNNSAGDTDSASSLLEVYAQAATLCAYRCKSLVERVVVGNEERTLRVHCGLACGKVSIMTVGSSDRREVLLTGTPLRYAGKGVELAPPEHAVLHSSVWDLVRTIAVCHAIGPSSDRSKAMMSKAMKFLGVKDDANFIPDGRGGWSRSRETDLALAPGTSNSSNSGRSSSSSSSSKGGGETDYFLVHDVTVDPQLATQQNVHQQLLRPPSADLLLNTFRSYMPPHLVKRWVNLQGHENDVRLVSTLFLNISNASKTIGYETSTEQLELLQEIFMVAQRVVNHHEGMIRQFIVDDKGCVLIVCFGVSTYRHKDDALRAIATAFDLQRSLGTLSRNPEDENERLHTCIGISTGIAFCGPIGSHRESRSGTGSSSNFVVERREFSVVGNCVNLAARMMSKAYDMAQEEDGPSSDKIFCDSATYENVRVSAVGKKRWGPTFLEVPCEGFKGISGKLKVYELQELAQQPETPRGNGANSVCVAQDARQPSSLSSASATTAEGQAGEMLRSQDQGEEEICIGRPQAKSFIHNHILGFLQNLLDPFILLDGEEGMGKTNLLDWARHQIRTDTQYSAVKLLGSSSSRVGGRQSYGHPGRRSVGAPGPSSFLGGDLGYGVAASASAELPLGGLHNIRYDGGLRGFLCDLFGLKLQDVVEDQKTLTDLVADLMRQISELPDYDSSELGNAGRRRRGHNGTRNADGSGRGRRSSMKVRMSDHVASVASGESSIRTRPPRITSVDFTGCRRSHWSKTGRGRSDWALFQGTHSSGKMIDPQYKSSDNRAQRRKSLPNPVNLTSLLSNPVLGEKVDDGAEANAEASFSAAAATTTTTTTTTTKRKLKLGSPRPLSSTSSLKNRLLSVLPRTPNGSGSGSWSSPKNKVLSPRGKVLELNGFLNGMFRSEQSVSDATAAKATGEEKKGDGEPSTPGGQSTIMSNNCTTSRTDSANATELPRRHSVASTVSSTSVMDDSDFETVNDGDNDEDEARAYRDFDDDFEEEIFAAFNGSELPPSRYHNPNLPRPPPPQKSKAHPSKLNQIRRKLKKRISSSAKQEIGEDAESVSSDVCSVRSNEIDEELLLEDEYKWQEENERLQADSRKFREAFFHVWNKIDENSLHVFLTSEPADIAQSIIQFLTSSTKWRAREKIAKFVSEESERTPTFSGTDALIAQQLCLVMLLTLEVRKQKVCVTIDDLEWLDEFGIMLLRSLIGFHGVMVITSVRSSNLVRVQQQLGFSLTRNAPLFVCRHTLTPLNESNVVQLLTQDFGIAEWPNSLISKVMTASKGLPLWAIEYVRGLMANSYIREDPETGSWVFETDDERVDNVFSSGLEGAILQRFDNLQESWKQAFQWACVIEWKFDVATIRDLLLFSEVQSQINELIDLDHIGERIDPAATESDERLFEVRNDLFLSTLGEDLKAVMTCLRSVPSPFTVHDVFKKRLEQVDDQVYQKIIQELCREGFLEKIEGSKDFKVAHDYYFQAVYNQIPPRQVVSFHRQTAQCLSSRENNDDMAPLLAWHYKKAKDKKNTVRYCKKAATNFLKCDDIAPALKYIKDAVEVADQMLEESVYSDAGISSLDTHEYYSLKVMLAECYLFTGMHSEAKMVLQDLEEVETFTSIPNSLESASSTNDETMSFFSDTPTASPTPSGALLPNFAFQTPPKVPMPKLKRNASLTSPGSNAQQSGERKMLGSRAASFTMRGMIPNAKRSANSPSTWSRDAGLVDRHNGGVAAGLLRRKPSRKYKRNHTSTCLPTYLSENSGDTSNSLDFPSSPEPPRVLNRSYTSLSQPRRRETLDSLPTRLGKPRASSLPENGNHVSSSQGSLRRAGAYSDDALQVEVSFDDGASTSTGFSSLSHSRSRESNRRPSFRRMYSSSMLHALPGLFKSKTQGGNKTFEFFAGNVELVQSFLLLLSTSYYNLEHDKFINRIKNFVQMMFDNGLPKTSAPIRLLVNLARCVSPKYMNTKNIFVLANADALVSQLNQFEFPDASKVDSDLAAGIIYKICALCSASKADWSETRDLLEKAQSSFRRSPLMEMRLYRKHMVDCFFIMVEGLVHKGNLVQADRLSKELSQSASAMLLNPQVMVWAEVTAALVRFRRFGILVNHKDITSCQDAVGTKNTSSVNTSSPLEAPGNTNERRTNLGQVPNFGAMPMNDMVAQMSSGDDEGEGDHASGIEGRLMNADKALWAALAAWKASDRNSPNVDRSEAIRKAAVAWDILNEAGPQALVWYMGLAYEMLFYAIAQIVSFKNHNAPHTRNHQSKKTRRRSMSFTTDSMRLLCKNYKVFCERFPSYRATRYRCKGLMYLIKDKPNHATANFRKGVKAAAKLDLEYERSLNFFLMREYCRDYLTKAEAGPAKFGAKVFGVSKSFPEAFAISFGVWRKGVKTERSHILDVLSSQNETLSPSRRSISTPSHDFNHGSFKKKIMRRRSSRSNLSINSTWTLQPAGAGGKKPSFLSSTPDNSETSRTKSASPSLQLVSAPTPVTASAPKKMEAPFRSRTPYIRLASETPASFKSKLEQSKLRRRSASDSAEDPTVTA